MSKVFLDISENMVGGRWVEITDILSIIPNVNGCFVSLKSIGVVRCRQDALALSQAICEAAKRERESRGEHECS